MCKITLSCNPRVIDDLILSKAFSISPNDEFRWKSGVLAPCYMDCRQLMGVPSAFQRVSQKMYTAIRDNFNDVGGIIGLSDAGIPWAASIAEKLNVPFGFIRKQRKMHGSKSLVEFSQIHAENIILVDDLIASGGSMRSALCEVMNQNLKIKGVFSIVNWGLPKMMENLNGVDVHSLVTVIDLINFLKLSQQDSMSLERVEHFFEKLTTQL